MKTRRQLLAPVLTGFVLPVALFYLLRACGVEPVLALLVGAAPALARTIYTVVRRGTIDAISLFTLSLLVVGALTAVITGSPRALLARGGFFTALIGLWILWSLRGRTLAFEGILTFQRRPDAVQAWEANWTNSPEFRHVMRAVTTIWGVGFLLEAVIRVVLAYVLPVDLVPGVTAVQFIALLVLMVWIAPRYGRRYMTRRGLTTGPDGITTTRITTNSES